MAYSKRVDRNQPEIVAALRAVGATVQHLHTVGAGCPDILVGFRGVNVLLELKDGERVPSEKKLSEDEALWHKFWFGQVDVAENAEQAICILKNIVSRETPSRKTE